MSGSSHGGWAMLVAVSAHHVDEHPARPGDGSGNQNQCDEALPIRASAVILGRRIQLAA